MTSSRLLCVDDNDDTCFLLTNILHFEGFESHSVGNGVDALYALTQKQFDLIILDVWMPDMSGYELCCRIREHDQTIPIIFYSADAYPDNIRTGIEAGADAYVAKPDFDNLLATVLRFTNTSYISRYVSR